MLPQQADVKDTRGLMLIDDGVCQLFLSLLFLQCMVGKHHKLKQPDCLYLLYV